MIPLYGIHVWAKFQADAYFLLASTLGNSPAQVAAECTKLLSQSTFNFDPEQHKYRSHQTRKAARDRLEIDAGSTMAPDPPVFRFVL